MVGESTISPYSFAIISINFICRIYKCFRCQPGGKKQNQGESFIFVVSALRISKITISVDC